MKETINLTLQTIGIIGLIYFGWWAFVTGWVSTKDYKPRIWRDTATQIKVISDGEGMYDIRCVDKKLEVKEI